MDRRSWQMWDLWLISLYLLPLVEESNASWDIWRLQIQSGGGRCLKRATSTVGPLSLLLRKHDPATTTTCNTCTCVCGFGLCWLPLPHNTRACLWPFSALICCHLSKCLHYPFPALTAATWASPSFGKGRRWISVYEMKSLYSQHSLDQVSARLNMLQQTGHTPHLRRYCDPSDTMVEEDWSSGFLFRLYLGLVNHNPKQNL